MNDDLLIKYLLEEADAGEREQVKSWLAASDENRKEFERFELIWNRSKELEQVSNADPGLAWERFKERVSSRENRVRPIRRSFTWLRIAAVLLITAGAWSFYNLFDGYNTIEARELVRTETLPDGSEVTLNRHSVISYQKDFSGKSRHVLLENGEVFFEVQPDTLKPFIIEAGEVSVLVLGTSFNVKHTDLLTEVIVETGKVQVSLGDQHLELQPGEKVRLTDADPVLRKQANTDKLYNYFRSNLFVADNTPLWRVVEVLNEAYDIHIVIEDPEIRNLPLSTTFKNEPIDNIIHIITETFKISAVYEDGKIILK
jgi:transmembrane sensor